MLSSADGHETKEGLIIRTCFYLIPTSLHLLGLYFLFTVKNLRTAEDQRLYLKHLSIAVLSICIFKIVVHVCLVIGAEEASEIVWCFQTTLFFTVYILILAVLTLDRFLSIYLNLVYPIYVTKFRVHLTLILAWIISSIGSVLIFLLMPIDRRRYFIVVYLWPIEEATFLVVAIPTYLYIFIKMYKNRTYVESIKRRVSQNQQQDINPHCNDLESLSGRTGKKKRIDTESTDIGKVIDKSNIEVFENKPTDLETLTDNVFENTDENRNFKSNNHDSKQRQKNLKKNKQERKRSTFHRLTHNKLTESLLKRKYSYFNRNRSKRRFFIPVLLILTFLLFWITPDLVELFLEHDHELEIHGSISFWVNLSYVLAMSSDAAIYIFGIPAINRRFRRRCIGLFRK